MVDTKQYQNALKSLWSGKFDVVVATYETDEKTLREKCVENTVISNQPCRISYKTVDHVSEDSGATRVTQTVTLFCSCNLVIPEGSKILVTQNGKTGEYAQSGKPAFYSQHQEIPVLFKGWA